MLPEAARQPETALTFRKARPDDGQAMWSLVQAMGGLELNTAYFYILYCLDYADTCLVAEQQGELAGFVLGHRPPGRDETVFVWQVGVAPAFRQQGLAARMIEALLHQQPRPVRWLEATVTPDNTASRRLFSGLARRLGANCDIAEYFKADWFPGDDHAPEDLFRIGPFDIESINA
ncbi:MAG: diaminobutyrate acetyltransferase [Wenzhouxiangella sp.]